LFLNWIPCFQDLANRYNGYVTDHENFNRKQVEFMDWINSMRTDVHNNFEVVGKFDLLQVELIGIRMGGHLQVWWYASIFENAFLIPQERRDKLAAIISKHAERGPEMESLVEAGELLYAHTSPEGRDIIRKQTRLA
jgi:hypothetical protein